MKTIRTALGQGCLFALAVITLLFVIGSLLGCVSPQARLLKQAQELAKRPDIAAQIAQGIAAGHSVTKTP